MPILKQKVFLDPSDGYETNEELDARIEVRSEDLSEYTQGSLIESHSSPMTTKSNCVPTSVLPEQAISTGHSPQVPEPHVLPNGGKKRMSLRSAIRTQLKEDSSDSPSTTKTSKRSPNTKPTKMVRNYAKVLCSFAYSDLALPYLKQIIHKDYQDSIEITGFQKYIKARKRQARCISTLRALLLVDEKDSPVERAYKKIFADISVVFLKFFAVNWIYSGRTKHRIEHLKCRHRMIRRVRNPESFTNLRN